jgi:RHH-type transcriptional regulator, proline utilization regulon repressor / proline dehydrogenase / delta 1-pyrroline-5-carboxylate dehydrogenase
MQTRPLAPLLTQSIELAEKWQNRANELRTRKEKALQEQLSRLLNRPQDKFILTKLIDQSFRSQNQDRVADLINDTLHRHGVPEFLSAGDKFLLRLFLGIGRHFPHISIPNVIEKMRDDSSRYIIPGEADELSEYLAGRKKEGVRININHLGEAVLGEEEAHRHLETYLAALRSSNIEYISVKVSSLISQIISLAFDDTVKMLKDCLSVLYRTALLHPYKSEDGNLVPKIVNLDMEEYRDMGITVAAFRQTLEQSEYSNYPAGIALQAYLPDAFAVQKELTAWARQRVENGGSPIHLRIVKGANLEMEKVESALQNWPLAPYDNKLDVDANYKRMVMYGMQPDNIRAVNLGIASHNLFDLAFAQTFAEKQNVTDAYRVEMLEGMADHVRRAIQETTDNVLLYAPVAEQEQFINAIAYLIRRLDENTGKENFLRYASMLETESENWTFLKHQFFSAGNHLDHLKDTPHRTQDRSAEAFNEESGLVAGSFRNEPNTDWSLSANRAWANEVRKKWKRGANDEPLEIPLVVGGKHVSNNRDTKASWDLSQFRKNSDNHRIANHALADAKDIQNAVATAAADPDGWRQKSYKQRQLIMSKVAQMLRNRRGDLMGAAAANTGKVFIESDLEVSEAIDFVEYYPLSALAFSNLQNTTCNGKGVGLVISPWNFPIAIPCGGIAAALAAGNTVIFKPSSNAVVVGWELCRCFWDAGVSKNTLQFLPCDGDSAGVLLTQSSQIDFIIFTGGTDTAMAISRTRANILLAAETGGKNATIVTSMSDRDQAIRDVIHSAFSNGGQKCSATSLLILEREVYDDPKFKTQLADAAKSFRVGSAWEFENRSGPLIRPPEGKLKTALTELSDEEEWIVQPHPLHDNPNMWSPGIKWNVQPGSVSHMTEFFGPVLSVLVAEDLTHAIDLANQTGYGLTSGLESLDLREHKLWQSEIRAGNLYINRETTGAVVLRQPFGGMGKSAIGAGIKVGGPNYVTQFMGIKEEMPPAVGAILKDHRLLQLSAHWEQKLFGSWENVPIEELNKTIYAIKSYLFQFEQEFSFEKDYFHLRGQDNRIRYLPIGKVVIRVHEEDNLFEVLGRIAAAEISGCEPILSLPSNFDNCVSDFFNSIEGTRFLHHTPIIEQTDEDLVAAIPTLNRIRYAAPDRAPAFVLYEAAKTGFHISRTPVFMEGRLELLQYFQEQSISTNYHRYGNLGERALEM